MRAIHPFRENSSLKPLLFCRGRDSRRASRESLRIKYKNDEDVFCNSRKLIKRLLAPAQRRRPDAICFCFVGRLSPQAKDLCGKLSTNDNITLSPAVGGRKKRNGESGQLQRLDPQKQIGRTSSGENSLFSPLARSSSRRQTPITLFRETRHSAVCVSQRSRTKERGLWFTPNLLFLVKQLRIAVSGINAKS